MFIRKLTLSCISALLLQLPTAHAQLGSDPDLFFKPAPDTPDLPADRYYPQGKKFIFTFYSVGAWVNPETNAHEAMAEDQVQQAFKDYKAAGFDLFGPQYEMNARMLEDAKQHNLSAVYTIKYPVNFHGKEPVNINPDEVREFITKEVKAVMDNPNIAIWYITPEELRYWRKNEMLYLEVASKAICYLLADIADNRKEMPNMVSPWQVQRIAGRPLISWNAPSNQVCRSCIRYGSIWTFMANAAIPLLNWTNRRSAEVSPSKSPQSSTAIGSTVGT